MSETKIKEADLAKITRQLLAHSGLVHWRVSNGAVMHRIGSRVIMKKSEIAGFPDWAGVQRNGTFWALELKSTKGRIAENQIEWMEKLAGTHAIVAVARTVEDVMEFISLLGGKVKKIN